MELPKRKPVRLQEYDYNSSGAYFLTLCTENRKNTLSRIVEGDGFAIPSRVVLLPFGEIADKYITQLNNFYDNLSVNDYVIMPNHMHIMLRVFDNGASRTSPPTKQHSTVSRFVSTFKRFCNKECGENIWQRHFNDHIIRNQEDYEQHLRYIYENPIRWELDELNTDK